MPKDCKHLTYDIRCQIYTLLKRGLAQAKIAKDLNFNQSTISREIKRNSGKRNYRYKQADTKARNRRKEVSSNPKENAY